MPRGGIIGERGIQASRKFFLVEIAQGVQPQKIRPLGVEHDLQEGPGDLRPALVKDEVAQGVGQALPAVAGESAGPVGMAADDEFDAPRASLAAMACSRGPGARVLLAPVQEGKAGLVRLERLEPVQIGIRQHGLDRFLPVVQVGGGGQAERPQIFDGAVF